MNSPKIPFGIKKIASMCVLKCEQRFLLLKRANEPNRGMFVPVGGKLEPHESAYQAVLRETFEETGIPLKSAKYCGTLTESSPVKYNWISFIYMAEIPYQPAPFCDEGTLEWIAIENLLKVPTPPTDWWIYKYILDHKPFAFSAAFDKDLNMLEMIEDIENVRVV